MENTEMRTYADGTHVGRRELTFSDDAARGLGMRTREDFFECRPSNASPRIWFKIGDGDAVMTKMRWEADYDYVSFDVPIDHGGRCPECNY